uniref:Uncharacterized protein n=1 Tax=Clastoptera arizonana TaxID=38151 RepID=A0A1B6DPM1_9HEMI
MGLIVYDIHFCRAEELFRIIFAFHHVLKLNFGEMTEDASSKPLNRPPWQRAFYLLLCKIIYPQNLTVFSSRVREKIQQTFHSRLLPPLPTATISPIVETINPSEQS